MVVLLAYAGARAANATGVADARSERPSPPSPRPQVGAGIGRVALALAERHPRLAERFEAIVLPDQAAAALRDGHAKGSMPEEYTGGLGEPGQAALRAFVEAGGTLVETADGYDLLVVATGAGRRLTGLAPELAGLVPIKGHILSAPAALGAVLRSQGAYAVPAAGGLMVGASMELGLDDRRVDTGICKLQPGQSSKVLKGARERHRPHPAG